MSSHNKLFFKLTKRILVLLISLMSILAKTTFGLACLVSGGTIFYVHYKQHEDREKLHEGVLRDMERQQRRKIENLHMLQQQRELTKQLQREASGQKKNGSNEESS